MSELEGLQMVSSGRPCVTDTQAQGERLTPEDGDRLAQKTRGQQSDAVGFGDMVKNSSADSFGGTSQFIAGATGDENFASEIASPARHTREVTLPWDEVVGATSHEKDDKVQTADFVSFSAKRHTGIAELESRESVKVADGSGGRANEPVRSDSQVIVANFDSDSPAIRPTEMRQGGLKSDVMHDSSLLVRAKSGEKGEEQVLDASGPRKETRSDTFKSEFTVESPVSLAINGDGADVNIRFDQRENVPVTHEADEQVPLVEAGQGVFQTDFSPLLEPSSSPSSNGKYSELSGEPDRKWDGTTAATDDTGSMVAQTGLVAEPGQENNFDCTTLESASLESVVSGSGELKESGTTFNPDGSKGVCDADAEVEAEAFLSESVQEGFKSDFSALELSHSEGSQGDDEAAEMVQSEQDGHAVADSVDGHISAESQARERRERSGAGDGNADTASESIAQRHGGEKYEDVAFKGDPQEPSAEVIPVHDEVCSELVTATGSLSPQASASCSAEKVLATEIDDGDGEKAVPLLFASEPAEVSLSTVIQDVPCMPVTDVTVPVPCNVVSSPPPTSLVLRGDDPIKETREDIPEGERSVIDTKVITSTEIAAEHAPNKADPMNRATENAIGGAENKDIRCTTSDRPRETWHQPEIAAVLEVETDREQIVFVERPTSDLAAELESGSVNDADRHDSVAQPKFVEEGTNTPATPAEQIPLTALSSAHRVAVAEEIDEAPSHKKECGSGGIRLSNDETPLLVRSTRDIEHSPPSMQEEKGRIRVEETEALEGRALSLYLNDADPGSSQINKTTDEGADQPFPGASCVVEEARCPAATVASADAPYTDTSTTSRAAGVNKSNAVVADFAVEGDRVGNNAPGENVAGGSNATLDGSRSVPIDNERTFETSIAEKESEGDGAKDVKPSLPWTTDPLVQVAVVDTTGVNDSGMSGSGMLPAKGWADTSGEVTESPSIEVETQATRVNKIYVDGAPSNTVTPSIPTKEVDGTEQSESADTTKAPDQLQDDAAVADRKPEDLPANEAVNQQGSLLALTEDAENVTKDSVHKESDRHFDGDTTVASTVTSDAEIHQTQNGVHGVMVSMDTKTAEPSIENTRDGVDPLARKYYMVASEAAKEAHAQDGLVEDQARSTGIKCRPMTDDPNDDRPGKTPEHVTQSSQAFPTEEVCADENAKAEERPPAGITVTNTPKTDVHLIVPVPQDVNGTKSLVAADRAEHDGTSSPLGGVTEVG